VVERAGVGNSNPIAPKTLSSRNFFTSNIHKNYNLNFTKWKIYSIGEGGGKEEEKEEEEGEEEREEKDEELKYSCRPP